MYNTNRLSDRFKDLETAHAIDMAKVCRPDDWASDTIVGIPLESPQRLTTLLGQRQAPEHTEFAPESRFKFCLANDDSRRRSARMLVQKMYAWRGYQTEDSSPQQPSEMTLITLAGDATIATLTVGFDSPAGLLVDQLYKKEIDSLRRAGRRICEFTKLAVDSRVRSKRVLGSLFHLAHKFGGQMYRHTDLLIEVNPRHVKFYAEMLGFTRYGPERLNPRVNAMAVLMRLEADYMQEQIEIFGGRADLGRTEKSLYPYFFSPSEELRIGSRLEQIKKTGSRSTTNRQTSINLKMSGIHPFETMPH